MFSLRGVLRLFRRQPAAPRLYWLTSDIAISREPADTDWTALRGAGVRCVVDLRAEAEDRGAVLGSHGLRYIRLPVIEGDAPTAGELRLVTSWIVERIGNEGPVLVHCREGRGRSAMVACATLVKLGIPLFDAFQALRRARPDVVLSEVQAEALRLFAQSQDPPPPAT